MGYGSPQVQLILELYTIGKLKDYNNVVEVGSQELHLKKKDFRELILQAGIDEGDFKKINNLDNWPNQPRTSSKELYKLIGIDNYNSIDINGELDSIPFDLNMPLEDKSLFNKFDIVTDFGSCEHVFNVSECYRTMHKLTKVNGLIIINQAVFKGNGYFQFDRSFMEGIAAANNYKIIFASYVINVGKKSSGSNNSFLIPLSEDLVKAFKDISSLNICMVLQKTSNEDFKIPYQGALFNEKYNIFGFNKIYNKDDLSLSYIPKYTLESVSGYELIKELINKIKKRIFK